MKEKQIRKNGKKSLKKSPVFLIALLNFLIIITILIYIIYLRFIPYEIITYDGYAVSGKDLVNNLLNSSFDVQENLEALEVKDQDEIYKNIKSYYVGADKTKNINLDYPIYVNDTLALYNLSADTLLYTDALKPIEGYAGFTLTSGALYNANTLERADYHNYILMKNSDNMYINTKEIKIQTANNKYTIKMNSIINFTDEYITYYSLKDKNFVYGKILDIDMNSKVIIKDYNKEYTYKEFLSGLDIIKEEVKDPVEEPEEVVEKEESKKETPKEENKIITEKEPENVIEEEPEKSVEEEIAQPDNGNGETKWQKPTVSSTDFVPNVYTATTEISIYDPSGAINKAITYTFYKDGEIAFRASALSSGTFKVSKLIPETKYNVIGTYQYKNENGGIIEVKFLDQEFKTLNTKNIKPIDLSFENGQIYSDKIQINNFKITSDITDEAISGVSRAEIIINGTAVPIKTAFLRSVLQGNVQNNQITDGIEPNTKYKYEFKFYDTANNEMKLNNNTGTTLTSKAIPTAKLKITNQNVISVELGITLNNQDNIELYNYKYILYNYKGKIVKQEDLTTDTKKLYFDNLNPEEVYRIKVFADYDIEDGNGIQESQEIGSVTFTTLSISQLGSLKLDLDYDDLTDNSIKLDTKITSKTDNRLIKILTEVNIEIQDENNKTIESINLNDINELSTEGVLNEIKNLESNTKYNIIVTAKAKQGDKEENVNTTYTLKSFTTKKKSVEFKMKNLVITTKLIDFDVIVYDKDGASLNGKYIVELRDEQDKLIDSKTISANEWIRCTYEELNKGELYTLTCYANQYNETNENRNVKGNYEIFSEEYITEGLGGDLELTGLTRRKDEDGKNLIDAQSYNNWYSKCFDVLNTEYVTDDDNKTTFNINSTARYGKTYNKDTKELTLTSNQCYVYNLKEYAGKKVTMSFDAKVSNNSIKDYIYIQKGKELGKNIEKLENITTSYKKYTISVNVPLDGYLGFYLSEDSSETLIIKNLQVELGETKSDYEDYSYNLEADIDIDFIDENYITGDKENKYSKYYIKILDNDTYEEIGYGNNSNEVKESKSYDINEDDVSKTYTVQLLIKVYGREYVLDEISFEYNQDTCYEIKSITSVEEFINIQPYGNYIISTDLKLTDASAVSEYTFGNGNIAFYGSIDFNGHTVEKDVYSSKINKEETSYIFYNLAETAKLKNLVLDVYIDNTSARYKIDILDGIYPLFLYNNGNIDNIIVNLNRCNKLDKRYVTLMGYQNKGKIENFIINFENTLYGSQHLSGVALYSNGTIQNGYMYGNGIEAIENITLYDSRYIAGLVYELQSGSVLQNIYTLAGIKINHTDTTKSYAANLVYNVKSGATVRNVYSLKEFETIYQNISYDKLLDENNKEIDDGPNIFINEGEVQFSYYFTGTEYLNNSYNTKQDTTVLNDYNFQDNLLNSNNCNSFNTEKYVKNGYYPHLKLNVCMPSQEKIKLDIEGDNSIIDVLSSNIVKYDDVYDLINYYEMEEKYKSELDEKLNNYQLDDENVHIAQFTVYNPSGKTISEIDIDYIENVDIFYQSYSKKMSTVYAVLSDATTFIDEYNIAYIKGKNITGKEQEVDFGENGKLGERSIEVSFIKHITSAEEWDNIDSNDINGVSGLIQNYKLDVDIDFGNEENLEYEPSISGTFTGTFDGQENKLSNISTNICLFERIDTSLKNLYVENFKIKSTSDHVGLIGKIGANSTIDNIHIKNIELESSYKNDTCYIGGIVGHVNGAEVTIQNISVNGFKVALNDSDNSHMIGGIVGYGGDYKEDKVKNNLLYIKNSYVQEMNINTKNTGISGIGGILGYGDSRIDIQYCYTDGTIVTDKPRIGGIYGYIVNPYSCIQKCYSLINITGNMTSGNNYIGGIGGYHTSNSATKNNLYLGNIYLKNISNSNSRRIVGNYDYTKEFNNYGYNDQIINGKKTSELYGATKLLAYDDVFDKYTYIDNEDKNNKNLEFGTMYNYDGLANKILPKLYDTRGNLLPNQKDNTLENGLKIMSVGFGYNKINTENDSIKITVEFENIDKLDLKDIGIVFENEDLELKEIESIENKAINDITYTTVVLIATPNRYYDTYKLSEIQYKNSNDKDRTLDSPMKISMPFYKEIYNADDWNSKIDTTSAENYKIMADIDFSGYTDIKTNASIGRLKSGNGNKTIKNATLEFNNAYSGLIKEIKTEISNINFDNITITSKKDWIGVIYKLDAPMNNCNFSNITIEGASAIGIISNCSAGGSIKTVSMTKIKVSGNSNIGGLVAYKKGYGDVANISGVTGTYIQVTGTGKNIGGIIGQSIGANITNVKVYQYDANGTRDSKDGETKYLVKGETNVGGCIGYSASWVNNLETQYSKIIASGENAGGCIGNTKDNGGMKITSMNNYISSTSNNVGGCIGFSGRTVKELTSENNTVLGANYVGGNIGHAEMKANESTATDATAWETENIVSGNNTIKGKSYVGGCIGAFDRVGNKGKEGYATNIRSIDNSIEGSVDFVGGCIGDSSIRMRNAKTYYTENTGGPKIIGNNYVGGIVGRSSYNSTSTGIQYYSIDGAYTNNVKIKGENFVGGISGQQLGTLYGGAVNDSIINATYSNAGGLVGYYVGSEDQYAYKLKCETFFLKHSFCTESQVTANENAGGLVGKFKYGNIQYCYVGNTNVTATTENAGGLVGYLDNSKMNSKQYIAIIKYNFIANTTNETMISSKTGVGGIIGTTNKDIYIDEERDEEDNVISTKYYIESNLVVSNVSGGNNYTSMGVGRIETGEGDKAYGINQSKNMKMIYVYTYSMISKSNSISYVKNNVLESNAYNQLTSDDFKEEKNEKGELTKKSAFKDTEKLNFVDSIGRFTFEDGYFPTLNALTATSTQTYWDKDNLNVTQEKIAIPEDPKDNLTSGTQLATLNLTSTMLNLNNELPNVYTYSVDVNKINIEFNKTSPYLYFDIKTTDDEILLERTAITERVYTFEYDFSTDLKITISNLDNWYTETINKDKVQNILDIRDNEYLYILDNNLYSSKREIDGQYLNLYNGKALSTDGNIYDLSTMKVIDKNNEKLKLLDEQIPIAKTNYEDIEIQAFYHCSKVLQEENYSYKDQQIFIKNGTMYLADGELDSIGNAIIIDSYNEKDYETILGTDGKIYDLLTKINYPSNFKNENIIAMTNNINSNDNVVLVYYSSGRVYGFNYITGEEIYDNNVNTEGISFISYFVNNLNLENALYETNKSSYAEAQKLTEKLEHVSISDALNNITENDTNSDTKEKTTNISNKNVKEKYITTYDAKTQNYVVYSTSELLDDSSEKMKSENEKINENDELISYYTNISTNKTKMKDLGIVIITIILLAICGGLVVMYRKNNKKKNR